MIKNISGPLVPHFLTGAAVFLSALVLGLSTALPASADTGDDTHEGELLPVPVEATEQDKDTVEAAAVGGCELWPGRPAEEYHPGTGLKLAVINARTTCWESYLTQKVCVRIQKYSSSKWQTLSKFYCSSEKAGKTNFTSTWWTCGNLGRGTYRTNAKWVIYTSSRSFSGSASSGSAKVC